MAADLWGQVEGQLARFGDLQALVEGVVGSEGHPHAIDGVRLRHLAGDGDAAAQHGGWQCGSLSAWVASHMQRAINTSSIP